ncbi:MFS transporter [Candidatus Woesearchaeota archaeon]|nr:MFS transporter [Candidatus Woesearchaeota archaeon]
MRKTRLILKITLFFFTLGTSLYGIFLPIYFLKNGLSMTQVMIFLTVYSLGGFASNIFSNYFLHRFGLNIFLITRGLVEPLVTVYYNSLNFSFLSLNIIGFISGYVIYSFWLAIDVFIMKSTFSKERGKQQGDIYSALWIAVILSPFIGGFLISKISYNLMFVFAFFLLIAGGILSFFIRLDVKIKKKLNWFSQSRNDLGKIMILNLIRGVSFGICGYLLGLLVFEIMSEEFYVGIFGLIFGVANLIATSTTGYLIDKLNKKKILFVLYLILGILWFGLILAQSSLFIFPLIVLANLFYQGLNVPMNTVFFNEIEKADTASLIAEKNMAFSFGQIMIFPAFIFFGYTGVFFFAGTASLLSLFFLKNLNLDNEL